MEAKDITGQKFNRLTAIEFVCLKNSTHYWKFKCDCGNEIIARKAAVTSGRHKSCGCLRLEKLKIKKYNEIKLYNDYAVMYVKHKKILLEVLLDIEDIQRVQKIGSWHAIYDKTLKNNSYYIAHRYSNKEMGSGVIKLHRFILNCPSDKIIDHINHNTLDNRKQNLKICTHFENQQNLGSKSTEQTGVYQRTRGIWCANITKNKKRYYKEFKTKEEAIKQRKEWEMLFYG